MTDDESQGSFGEAIDEAVKAAEDTVRHPFTRKLARWGFYTKGYLFIIIGFLAVFVATGVNNGKLAAPTGALSTIAQLPFGRIILVFFIIGALSHGIWNILRGVADVDGAGKNLQGIGKRIIPVGIGIFYLVLSWFAFNLIITSRAIYSNDEIPKTITSLILSFPLGSVLIFLIGLGIIGAGIHELYSGITGKYKKNFLLFGVENNHLKIITWLGYLSFTARAVLLFLMGYYFIWAAVDYNASEVIGMDGALLALSQTYYGKTILFITAIGLISHGFLSLYEAKYRRLF
ncbi:MAG: DUF1206 domain-containing protein [Pyrinomonadaceae bacterium]